jgi:hypothetical protein
MTENIELRSLVYLVFQINPNFDTAVEDKNFWRHFQEKARSLLPYCKE